MDHLDLLVVADPRLRFAAARSLAALLRTAARRGYRVALLPVHGPLRLPGGGCSAALRALLAEGEVVWLDSDHEVHARLALIYDILPVLQPLQQRLAIEAEQVLLRIDQPLLAADGTELAAFPSLMANAAELFGVTPEVVVADALIARDLPARHAGAELWPPVSDLDPAPRASATRPLRVGRHTGGGFAAAPPAGLMEVLLGEGELSLAEEAAGLLPPGRTVACHPGELAAPAAYFAGLDAYLMATGPAWKPFLPPGLVEALAAGVPLLAPVALEPILGDAALYPGPDGLPAALREATGPRRAALRAAAQALHAGLTGPEALAARLERRLGAAGPHPQQLRLRRDARTPRRALFLSPNGIGMGHLTRLLAVARRTSPSLEPIFLSMSQAVGVVEGMGFLAEHFPYNQHTGEPADRWNAALKARLDEAIAFYDARLVVFDGNVPYQGLIDARLAHQNRGFVWIRRGLWRPEAGRATVERARYFDLVIEPGDFAAELDAGPTATRRGEAVLTPPVTLFDPGELLTREAARAELGLDPARLAVLVQLGSRNNFDYAEVDAVLRDELAGVPGIELVVVDWLIGQSASEMPESVRRLRTFPTSRYLRAFDVAVSAAGYNSFHELLGAGVPSVFVPNENPMMDAQELRGLWAERAGVAFCARRHDPYRLAWALRRLRDPAQRAAMAARAAALPACSGGLEIARLLEEAASARRVPPAGELPAYTPTRAG